METTNTLGCYFSTPAAFDMKQPAPEGYLYVEIPFPGFYESVYVDMFNNEVEREAEYYRDEMDTRLEDEYREVILPIDKVCELYLERFAHVCELDKPKYVGVRTPRFYNYAFDHLYALVKKDDLRKIVGACNKEVLAHCIKDATTHRIGYHANYKPSDFTFDDDMPAACWLEAFLAWMDTYNADDVETIAYDSFEWTPMNEILDWVPRKQEQSENKDEHAA